MSDAARKGVRESVAFGLIAGAIFFAMEVVGAALMGRPALMPLRAFASVLLGARALETASLGAVFVVGLTVHFVLSAVYGLTYGLFNAGFSARTETSWGRQVGLGLLFGAMLWLVNFQIIARMLYPWFLMMPQLPQMLMHAMFFGLPLALMYAAAERRLQHVGHAA